MAMDTDDAMRMVQVQDLHQGGGWFNLTQDRLNPPQGVRMHWSRFPDLFLCTTYAVCARFYDRDQAVQVTAILIPPLLALLYYAVFLWSALPLINRTDLPTAGILCLCLLLPLLQFKPYRVDHHGWQIILALCTLGTLLRARHSPPLIFGGLVGALGLWIGAESYLFIGLACIALSFQWIFFDTRAAGHLARYGLALLVSVILLYPLALAPHDWATQAADAFSLNSLGLACAVFAYGFALNFLNKVGAIHNQIRRTTAAGLVAGTIALLLLLTFNDYLHGPYGKVGPTARALIEHTTESQPLTQELLRHPFSAITLLLLPLFALLLSARQFLKAPASDKVLWAHLSIFIIGGILLQLWQQRASPLSHAFAGIALSWWAAQQMNKGEQLTHPLARLSTFALPFCLILSLEFGPLLLEPSFQTTMEAPAKRHDLHHLIAVLNNRDRVGQGPFLLATHSNIGPRILLQTQHKILAAPYHRNDDGLQATMNIFGEDEQRAKQTIKKRKVDLLYVYKHSAMPLTPLEPDKGSQTSLWMRLQQSPPPPWLEEIPIPDAEEGEHLFRPVF